MAVIGNLFAVVKDRKRPLISLVVVLGVINKLWRLWLCRQKKSAWAAHLKQLAHKFAGPSNKVLVIVNPSSGGKQGQATFDNVVSPALLAANVEMDTRITKNASDLKTIAVQVDIRSANVVLIVGGDGTLHEFLNAYVRGHEKGLDHFKSASLCPVPAGTCNGLAVSLGFRDPEQAMDRVLDVLSGNAPARPFDLYSVLRVGSEGPKLLDFHLTCWGIMADVDLALERVPRSLPSVFRGVWRFLVPIVHVFRLRARRASVVIQPLEGSRIEETGEFLMIGIQNVRWTDATVQLAPAAKLDDGLIHVCLWRKGASCMEAISIFQAMESGDHIHKSHISMHSAQSVELCPESGEMDVCGTGESGLPAPMGGRIKIEVLPSAMYVV